MNKPKKIQSVNQLTSISFGTDKPKWISINRKREQSVDAWGATKFDPQRAQKLREQKQALQRSKISLGDERCDFSTSSTLENTTGKMQQFRGQMAVQEAKQLRMSHIHLGTFETRYQSSAQSQNVWAYNASAWQGNRSSSNGAQVDFEARKRNARKVNFKLGDSATAYDSLAKSSYRDPVEIRTEDRGGWKPPKNATKQKTFEESSEDQQTEMLLDDLRGAHFSLGTDRSNFRTSTQGK